MTDRENAALELEDQEGWDGLVRLFDDLVRDSWGGFDSDSDLDNAVDPSSGVYDSAHFVDLLKKALGEVRQSRTERGFVPDLSHELAVVATRIVDWERQQEFFGERGRAKILLWVAGQLEALLGPEDDIGRVRADTFGLLLRGRSAEQLSEFAERCVEAVESEPCEVYSTKVEVRIRTATIACDGDHAERLVEQLIRETSED